MNVVSNLIHRGVRIVVAVALALPMSLLLSTGMAHATTNNSIYSYALDGSSAIVANAAASNSGANLSLQGNWSQSSYGVHFAGDLVSQSSVGQYKPASGNTINAAAGASVGVATRFTFQAPTSGNCFSDSSNITQIGRFAANTAQVKLQYSNCGNNSNNVFMECRLAGSATPTTVLPVRNALPLENGATYIAKCYKTPDPASGNATATLRVVKVNTTTGNTVEDDSFSISPTGAITSSAYLSVGNKYPLPAQANNTDQFVGDIAKVSYCQATLTIDVQACLDSEVPEPSVTVLPQVVTTLSASPTSVTVGQQTTFTAGVQNPSGQTATGASVSVTLPSTMSVVNVNGGSVSGNTVTWSLGDLAAHTTTNAQVVVQLNSGTVGDTPTATAATTTTDTACTNAGSNCSASASVTIVPTITEWVTNPGVETNLTGWTGSYGSKTLVSVTRNIYSSHSGSADILVLGVSGASNSAVGFSDSPRWVTNTVAGKTYNASMWVKPGFIGQSIVLRQRELNGATIVTDTKTTLVATSTNWQQITNSITPVSNGNQLAFAVYGGSMNPGDSFEVDDMSLTSN